MDMQERGQIIVKILDIAKGGAPFNRMDCIDKHFGYHASMYWQECLDELALAGRLTKIGEKYMLSTKGKLTKELAIIYAILIWETLAITGGDETEKQQLAKQFGEFDQHCPLCELARHNLSGCLKCPYYKKFGGCIQNGYATGWSGNSNIEERKTWAKKFLSQLLQLQASTQQEVKPNDMPMKVEVWENVTAECEVKLGSTHKGHYVALYHKGDWLIEFGIDKTRLTNKSNYKIENSGQSFDFCCFRIMKRIK